jgi:ferredoxin
MPQRSTVVRAYAHPIAAIAPRKRLVRKTERDYSQALRHGFQIAFLLLNAWLGATFFRWVRQFETGIPKCTGCLECVAICPAQDALQMSFPRLGKKYPASLPAWALAAGIAILFFGMVTYAKVTGHWESRVSPDTYRELIPHAGQATHPMP